MASSVPRLSDDDQKQAVYSWLDSIPLSRPKRNCTRDFSDGGEVASLVQLLRANRRRRGRAGRDAHGPLAFARPPAGRDLLPAASPPSLGRARSSPLAPLPDTLCPRVPRVARGGALSAGACGRLGPGDELRGRPICNRARLRAPTPRSHDGRGDPALLSQARPAAQLFGGQLDEAEDVQLEHAEP